VNESRESLHRSYPGAARQRRSTIANYFDTREAALEFIREYYAKDGSKPRFLAQVRHEGRARWLVVYSGSERPYDPAYVEILEDQSAEIDRLL
jgi:hypothetical protein